MGDLRNKYIALSKLENEIESQEDALISLETEITDSENLIKEVGSALDKENTQYIHENHNVDEQSDLPEFNDLVEDILVLQSNMGGWSSSYEPKKCNSRLIENILPAVTHDLNFRPRRYPSEHYQTFYVSSSWFKTFFLLR